MKQLPMLIKPHTNMYYPHPHGALEFLMIHNHGQPQKQNDEELLPLQLHLLEEGD
ncbi:hypothetical protein [Lactococcus protaetiae]|uniref:hypothetical protein n=1 Tax=Lactococcus protaetiae TaxID=2592653 RepID=UPI0016806EDA|nr:hypothetical protein [Lactococcus protaetiae]MCL2113735.1 hypothetical protein [Streptococcaceae bacterium]